MPPKRFVFPLLPVNYSIMNFVRSIADVLRTFHVGPGLFLSKSLRGFFEAIINRTSRRLFGNGKR